MRNFEGAWVFLVELDRILQGVDLPDILLVREVDKETDHGNGVACANHLPGQGVSARPVIGGRGVLILIDDLHSHVALAGLGQHVPNWPSIEVDNRERIQRVAIGARNALLSGWRKLAAMAEFTETAVLDHAREIDIRLRAIEGAKLTDAGSRLYEHASRGIDALLEAEQAVVSDQARLKGRLRLSLPQTFEPWWDLLAAFQRRYPDIQVYVYSTERRMDLIEDGIDVALRAGPIVHEAMVARHVLSFRNILVASPKLVERFGVPAEPDALHRFPCAVWASGI